MAERAFRTQFVQQVFAFDERLGADVAFEEPLPATRDFLFSKHSLSLCQKTWGWTVTPNSLYLSLPTLQGRDYDDPLRIFESRGQWFSL